MNKNNIIPFIFTTILIFVAFKATAQEIKYENWNGVSVDSRPDTTNPYRYTEDNKVYKGGNIYYYSYYYRDTTGRKFCFQYLPIKEDTPEWKLVPKDSVSDSTIVLIRMEVRPGKGKLRTSSKGTQTVVQIDCLPLKKFYIGFWSETGLIENERNIWMYPFRDGVLDLLRINPHPFIQKPYKKGHKFKCHFEIGGYWGQLTGKEKKGIVKNKCQYEITDTNSIVNTALGDLVCYKIESFAKSKIGKSYLTAYFNEKYGFVRLDYTNIDKSKIVIELSKAELKEEL